MTKYSLLLSIRSKEVSPKFGQMVKGHGADLNWCLDQSFSKIMHSQKCRLQMHSSSTTISFIVFQDFTNIP